MCVLPVQTHTQTDTHLMLRITVPSTMTKMFLRAGARVEGGERWRAGGEGGERRRGFCGCTHNHWHYYYAECHWIQLNGGYQNLQGYIDDCSTEFWPRYFAKLYTKKKKICLKVSWLSVVLPYSSIILLCSDKCVGVDSNACNWQLQAGMSKMFHNGGHRQSINPRSASASSIG